MHKPPGASQAWGRVQHLHPQLRTGVSLRGGRSSIAQHFYLVFKENSDSWVLGVK